MPFCHIFGTLPHSVTGTWTVEKGEKMTQDGMRTSGLKDNGLSYHLTSPPNHHPYYQNILYSDTLGYFFGKGTIN